MVWYLRKLRARAEIVFQEFSALVQTRRFRKIFDRPTVTHTTKPITTARVTKELVLQKCEYFVDVQLWPVHAKLDPIGWLSNFEASEMELAFHLLNAFLFFSEDVTNEMFRAAFHGLSNALRSPGDSYLGIQRKWKSFMDSCVITYVTGEVPSPTDSGLAFARKARQELSFDETRILPPDKSIELLLNQRNVPVVFVDDFVGSGYQFMETWHREYNTGSGIQMSFDRLSSTLRSAQFYYCPLISTEDGAKNIQRSCPGVHVRPAHVIPWRYSALVKDSIIWPSRLQPAAVDFLKRASDRAGIPDTGGADECDWQGFHCLGLTMAFAHGVPDATLPIFYWEDNGWRPLIKKS